MPGGGDPLVPGGQGLQVLAHVSLLRVCDGQDGEVAVDHAEDDAVPVGGGLEGAQV